MDDEDKIGHCHRLNKNMIIPKLKDSATDCTDYHGFQMD
jgi:hypothetical protein